MGVDEADDEIVDSLDVRRGSDLAIVDNWNERQYRMITKIEIGGYRLLDEFEADFKPLTVVIGANAVGKSTLIDCLQLIAECCDVPLNTAMVGIMAQRPFLRQGTGMGN